MERREFLKTTIGGAIALAAAGLSAAGAAQDTVEKSMPAKKLRGVNLGSWLVLEKWMAPEPYEGTKAEDEYSLCLGLGAEAKARLDRHRETFITAEDFQWIRDCGLNAVRLPVGYWALEAPRPYVESARFIDFALDQCQQNGLALLLDLHGAPGSQNGWDHSGRSGPVNWPKDPKNVQETLRILDTFAQRFGQHPALCGIELLNEPRNTVPLPILQDFYQEAYARLRQRVGPRISIVFHDSFRPFAWKQFMREPDFQNVILDTHLYQCFDREAKARSATEHLAFALQRKETLEKMQREELPAMVGEWSLAWPGRAMRGLSPFQAQSALRAYANTQLLTYEETRGWFFWSYKLAAKSAWNFRHGVEQGWLPARFTA